MQLLGASSSAIRSIARCVVKWRTPYERLQSAGPSRCCRGRAAGSERSFDCMRPARTDAVFVCGTPLSKKAARMICAPWLRFPSPSNLPPLRIRARFARHVSVRRGGSLHVAGSRSAVPTWRARRRQRRCADAGGSPPPSNHKPQNDMPCSFAASLPAAGFGRPNGASTGPPTIRAETGEGTERMSRGAAMSIQ